MQIERGDARALGQEAPRDRFSDAARCAGDERHACGESLVVAHAQEQA